MRFVTKAGLSAIETAEVELVDPAELNRPKPGAVTGKLVELAEPTTKMLVALSSVTPFATSTPKPPLPTPRRGDSMRRPANWSPRS